MSNTDYNIIRDFQANFDQIQKVIYGTSENSKGLQKTESEHLYVFSRTTWYNRVPRTILATENNGSYSYKLNNGKHDLLMYTSLRQQLPAIVVRDVFQDLIEICWVRNIGINTIRSGQLLWGEDKVTSIDTKSIEAEYKIFKSNADKDFFDSNIGNIPMLTSWNSFLPSKSTIVEQPWFYSKDKSLGLPIYYAFGNKNFVHTYVFNRSIQSLLRMRRIVPANERKNPEVVEYQYIETDLKYVHVENKLENLSPPEMMGIYVKLLPDEVDAHKCMTESNSYGDFYIEDVAVFTSENPSKYGNNLSVEVKEDAIAHTLVWMAENKSATDMGILSNYTTNTIEMQNGYDPIETTSLRVGSNDYFKELHSDYTRCLFMRDFPGKVASPGFHAFSFSSDPTSMNAKMGVNTGLLTSKLTVKLKDTNPFLKQLDPITGKALLKASESPEFLLHVYLLITRKISFYSDGKDGWELKFNSREHRDNPELTNN